jgi:DNA invertase Pin-like site-specific DNA recombinase
MKKRRAKKYKFTGRSLKNPSAPHKRGIIYLRASHWGNSFLAQQTLCENYRDQNNIELIRDEFSDDGEYVTGLTVLESPGFNDLLEYCKNRKNKVDVLIVAGRDRLGTNTAEYLKCNVELHQLGVEILSASDIQDVDSSLDDVLGIIGEYQMGIFYASKE